MKWGYTPLAYGIGELRSPGSASCFERNLLHRTIAGVGDTAQWPLLLENSREQRQIKAAAAGSGTIAINLFPRMGFCVKNPLVNANASRSTGGTKLTA
jgi:hypothetical protein